MIATMSEPELIATIFFLPVLIATGYSDLRNMRIPNMLSLIGLAIFACTLLLIGFDEWLMRACVGASCFAICFALFAVGWLGGGDAKILPVTILFVPVRFLEIYLLSFAVAMLLGMVAIWLARHLYSHPQALWVSMQPGAAFPMGISIATSLPLALLVILYVFS